MCYKIVVYVGDSKKGIKTPGYKVRGRQGPNYFRILIYRTGSSFILKTILTALFCNLKKFCFFIFETFIAPYWHYMFNLYKFVNFQ